MGEVKIALLLPSRRRFKRLFETLWVTSVYNDTKFFIAADYPWYEQVILKLFFWNKSVIVDDRKANTIGMNKAYNRALNHALEYQPEYCVLWADDLVPEKKNWLSNLKGYLKSNDVEFGIFSTDEGGHKGIFGWNFWGEIPCAHFCIMKTNLLNGFMLHPELVSYFGDNEISLRMKKKGVKISLLPIRVHHFPTDNETRRITSKYYMIDKGKLYELHPEITGVMDPFIERADFRANFSFIYDDGSYFDENMILKFIDYDAMIEKGNN